MIGLIAETHKSGQSANQLNSSGDGGPFSLSPSRTITANSAQKRRELLEIKSDRIKERLICIQGRCYFIFFFRTKLPPLSSNNFPFRLCPFFYAMDAKERIFKIVDMGLNSPIHPFPIYLLCVMIFVHVSGPSPNCAFAATDCPTLDTPPSGISALLDAQFVER